MPGKEIAWSSLVRKKVLGWGKIIAIVTAILIYFLIRRGPPHSVIYPFERCLCLLLLKNTTFNGYLAMLPIT